MNYLSIPFFFILPFTTYCQISPYDTLKFDKVILYDFNELSIEKLIVDKKGNLDSSVTKRVVLENKAIVELNCRLGSRSSYVEDVGLCFFPHLGIVYYLKGKIVAHVTICVQCDILHSSLEIPAQRLRVSDIEDEMYCTGGLSDSLKYYFNDLLTSHKFSHALDR